jgi:hypothetical protein
MVPLGPSYWNHRSFNVKDRTVDVIKTSPYYNALIPAWYLEKHKASGTTTTHLHYPHCSRKCSRNGKLHLECSITQDKRVSTSNRAIHIGAVVVSHPSLMQKLPAHYHRFILVFTQE